MFPSSMYGPIRVKAPEADWAELFALSRTVAHRREPYPLLGWIEDRLPDPVVPACLA